MTNSETTTLILIRHGETVWNIESRFQGHFDSPLTQRGREQIKALGKRMKGFTFNELFASDLGRTVETAAIITGFTEHEVQTDPRLRERHYGVLEGLTLPEINVQYADILDRLKTNDPNFIIPDGESHYQHYMRNIDFVEEKIAEKSGESIVLVVHGGVLDNLFRYVAGLGLDHPRCITTLNASLCILRHGFFYGTTRWVIETWGDVAHLDTIGRYVGLG